MKDEGMCASVSVRGCECDSVCVCVRVQAGWKHSQGDPAPLAACVCMWVCVFSLTSPSLSLSRSVWFTPACVSVGAGPSGQIWRSCGHSLHTWRASPLCVSCNASSAHQSGRTSRCNRPRYTCMAFHLERKSENTVHVQSHFRQINWENLHLMSDNPWITANLMSTLVVHVSRIYITH